MAEDKTTVQIVNKDKIFNLFETKDANFGRYGYSITGWKKTPGETHPGEIIYSVPSAVYYKDIENSEESAFVDLYAIWERNYYSVVAVTRPAGVNVSITGTDPYPYEDTASVQADSHDENYKFEYWKFPDESESTENPVEFTVLSAVELSAFFKDLRTIRMTTRSDFIKLWRHDQLPAETGDKLIYRYQADDGNLSVARPFLDDQHLSVFSELFQLSVSEERLSVIGPCSFAVCEHLLSVDCPAVKFAESSAFYGCRRLEYIDLPQVVSAAAGAFQNCSSLVSASFPEMLSIGASAFSGCSQMSSIDIPKTRVLSDGVFTGCSSLSSIDLPELVVAGQNVFNGTSGAFTPVKRVTCPKIETVSQRAFYGCGVLDAVPGIKNAISVGDEAFRNCSSFTSINIGRALDVGASAFSDCSGLTSITLESVSAIGQNAFQNCASLIWLDFGYHLSSPPNVVTDNGGIFRGVSNKVSCYVPPNYYQNWAEDETWSSKLSDNVILVEQDVK